MDEKQVTCVNCQAVTTNDGRTVWVCEKCGTENPASVPDAKDAQAQISSAAQEAGVAMPSGMAAPTAPPFTEPAAPATPTPTAPTPEVTPTTSQTTSSTFTPQPDNAASTEK